MSSSDGGGRDVASPAALTEEGSHRSEAEQAAQLVRATVAAMRCESLLERKEFVAARVEYLYFQSALRELEVLRSAYADCDPRLVALRDLEKKLGRALATRTTPSSYKRKP